MYTIKMAVRQLVEFLYQGGDISHAFLSAERANLGSRIHRKIQKASGEGYESEVFLKESTILEDVEFIIEGRADGILTKEDGSVLIDEIKSTSVPYDEIKDLLVHWAQAYCYAYFYMKQNDLKQAEVQLTYVQIDDDKIRRFQKDVTFSKMEKFYLSMLQEYHSFAKQRKDFETLRNETIQNLTFPFAQYRKGQREFAVSVYRAIQEKKELYAMAPTGIGKTVSTLFPSIKSLRELHTEKIFYLCAKNITASVAKDTMHLLYDHGLRMKCVCLNAKDKMCLLQERNCDPDECPYAKGYYDRLQKAVKDILESYDMLDRESFLEYGKQYQLCPFELSLDLSLYADLIICDYNYVYDPHVFLKRYMLDGGDYVFLVDEAHNLVDRARDMYSAQLNKQMFLDIRHHLDGSHKELRKDIDHVNSSFRDMKKAMEDSQTLISEEPFYGLNVSLNMFLKSCDQHLQKEHRKEDDDALRDLYYAALSYLRISEIYDENYVTILQKVGKDLTIKQFCMDPHNQLQQMKDKGRTTVFFSATLTPISYFLSLLGGDENSMKIWFPSAFDASQSCLLINDTISTRYHDRSSSLDAVCEDIYITAAAKPGNYITFFPSYQYMKMVYERYTDRWPDQCVRLQTTGMNDLEKESFMQNFTQQNETQLFFCVLGGMFAEGIDLKGDKLIGVIIVGVGLPQLSQEHDLIKKHFNEEHKDGYHYAYTYPGMNKVLQAAGRVIRSIEDKGVILLLDQRFTQRVYRNLFPPHFSHYKIIRNSDTLRNTLQQFWKES